jgi:hypothetical protein
MKLRITIEEADDNGVAIPKAPKTSMAMPVNSEEPKHHARLNAVLQGFATLIRHESIKFANYERSVALESIDSVLADAGEDEDVRE